MKTEDKSHQVKNCYIFKKRPLNFEFKLDKELLEMVTYYKYLGILFSNNNSFYETKKHVAEQGTRAMYSLLAKSRI